MTVAVLFVLALVTLCLVIGLWIPRQREFVKQANLKSSPEKIFKIVTDFKNQTDWRTDVQAINIIDQNTWTEIPNKGMPITFRIKKKVENQLFEIEIIEPDNFKGYWVGNFEQTQTGTKVVFKEVIIIENPFFRVLASIFVNLDKNMEVYMRNLKTKLDE